MPIRRADARKIVVDSGKYATKAIARNDNGKLETLYFETRMNPTDETTTSAEGTVVVEVEEGHFLLGKMAMNIDSDTTKAKEVHKFAIYRAIHHFIEDGEDVDLVIGCPLSVYTVREKREAYEEYIKEKGKIHIGVNEEEKHFQLTSVLALPEGSGYVFRHIPEFLNNLVAVIDIGGLNTNACLYEGTNMVTDTDLTHNMGTNILRSALQKHLNKMLGINLSERQVEFAMKERVLKKDPKASRRLIDAFMYEHVLNLRENLKKNNWGVENLDFVFLGGGSILLEKEIKEIFGDGTIISKTAVWDNAEGFAELVDL
jgi:plasmid segregation protein ParM